MAKAGTKTPSARKAQLKRHATSWGANLFGVANVERWAEDPHQLQAYWPQSIWPWAQSVIVLGAQIYPSMIETTPSVVYSELYNTTNRMLDEIAYRVANELNQQGFRAHFFPRDCYGDISVLVKKPEAAFSQVLAGLYAGLGTIGWNHTLLTKAYGPRVRLVSVITDAVLPPDPLMKKDLCRHCGLCVKHCPMKALTPPAAGEHVQVAEMDKHKCAQYHAQLKSEFRYPCGRCAAVCPVGEDKKIYGAHAVSPEGIAHVQDFGSKNAVEDDPERNDRHRKLQVI